MNRDPLDRPVPSTLADDCAHLGAPPDVVASLRLAKTWRDVAREIDRWRSALDEPDLRWVRILRVMMVMSCDDNLSPLLNAIHDGPPTLTREQRLELVKWTVQESVKWWRPALARRFRLWMTARIHQFARTLGRIFHHA